MSQHQVKPPKEVDPQSGLKDSKVLLVGEKNTEAKDCCAWVDLAH